MTSITSIKKAQVTNDLIRPRVILPNKEISFKEKLNTLLLSTIPFLVFLPLSFILFTKAGTHATLFILAVISSFIVHRYFTSVANDNRMKNSILAHSDEILSTSKIRYKTSILTTKLGSINRYTVANKWLVATTKGTETVIHDPKADLLYISYSDQKYIHASNYERLKSFLDGWIRKDYPFSSDNIASFRLINKPFSKAKTGYVELTDGRSFMIYPNDKQYPMVTEETHSNFLPSTN